MKIIAFYIKTCVNLNILYSFWFNNDLSIDRLTNLHLLAVSNSQPNLRSSVSGVIARVIIAEIKIKNAIISVCKIAFNHIGIRLFFSQFILNYY